MYLILAINPCEDNCFKHGDNEQWIRRCEFVNELDDKHASLKVCGIYQLKLSSKSSCTK